MPTTGPWLSLVYNTSNLTAFLAKSRVGDFEEMGQGQKLLFTTQLFFVGISATKYEKDPSNGRKVIVWLLVPFLGGKVMNRLQSHEQIAKSWADCKVKYQKDPSNGREVTVWTLFVVRYGKSWADHLEDMGQGWKSVYTTHLFRVTGPLCGEFTGPGEFPTQRPVTRRFDVFFDLRLNKWLSKQPWGWWFETPSWSLWRLYYVFSTSICQQIDAWTKRLTFCRQYFQMHFLEKKNTCIQIASSLSLNQWWPIALMHVPVITCQNLQFWQVCSFVGLLLAKIYNFWQVCSFVGLLLAKISKKFASMFVCRFVCLLVCQFCQA